jgi:hypothetical protein
MVSVPEGPLSISTPGRRWKALATWVWLIEPPASTAVVTVVSVRLVSPPNCCWTAAAVSPSAQLVSSAAICCRLTADAAPACLVAWVMSPSASVAV